MSASDQISLPIPPGLEKSEEALGSVDVNKSWDEYAERVLEEVREFETWRQSRQVRLQRCALMDGDASLRNA